MSKESLQICVSHFAEKYYKIYYRSLPNPGILNYLKSFFHKRYYWQTLLNPFMTYDKISLWDWYHPYLESFEVASEYAKTLTLDVIKEREEGFNIAWNKKYKEIKERDIKRQKQCTKFTIR